MFSFQKPRRLLLVSLIKDFCVSCWFLYAQLVSLLSIGYHNLSSHRTLHCVSFVFLSSHKILPLQGIQEGIHTRFFFKGYQQCIPSSKGKQKYARIPFFYLFRAKDTRAVIFDFNRLHPHRTLCLTKTPFLSVGTSKIGRHALISKDWLFFINLSQNLWMQQDLNL